jgi:y4mF family transcriptional regulator
MLLHIINYICLKSLQKHIITTSSTIVEMIRIAITYDYKNNEFPSMKTIADFVKEKRNEVNLTQEAFAERAGVALTVIRKIEQGKENLNLEKVNQVLKMFGHTLAPVNARELSKSED